MPFERAPHRHRKCLSVQLPSQYLIRRALRIDNPCRKSARVKLPLPLRPESLPMDDFFFARSLMAMSLAFHIVFAALGIGMPLLMVLAEGAYIRSRKPVYLELAKRWAKGTAVLF